MANAQWPSSPLAVSTSTPSLSENQTPTTPRVPLNPRSPHLFRFDELDWTSTDYIELREYLETNYDVPSEEFWTNAETKFGLLRRYFEEGTADEIANAEEVQMSSEEPITESPQARKTRLPVPRVKIFKACTFLQKVAATSEPLVCKAVGTIAPKRYEDVFWERVAKLEQEQNIKVNVWSIDDLTAQDITFLLELDGCQFKLRYIQWGTLIQKYPNVLDVPDFYLDDNVTVPELACGYIRGLKYDVEKTKQLDENVSRLAYYYIRAWAINRGLYRRKQVHENRSINPRYIVDCLTCKPSISYLTVILHTPLYDHEANSEHASAMKALSTFVLQFFEHFSIEYASINGKFALGNEPYAEDDALDWLDLLKDLEDESVTRKMGCSHYVRVNLVFVGSDVKGGEWLRDIVEPRVKRLMADYKSKLGRDTTVYPWQYRCTSTNPRNTSMLRGNGTYEGYYVIGLDGCEPAQEPLVQSIVSDWHTVMEMNGHHIPPDGCQRILTARVLTAKEMEEVPLYRCTKVWPYEAIKAPDNPGQFIAESPVSPISNSSRRAQMTRRSNDQEPSLPLRTAGDVLNRLKFDLNFKVDDWKVGYVDRHMQAMQEIPVRNWVTDTTDMAFIPEHRIEYFKVYPQGSNSAIMWEKATKKDLIFTGLEGRVSRQTEEGDEVLSKRERQGKAREEREKKKSDESWEVQDRKKESKAEGKRKGKGSGST